MIGTPAMRQTISAFALIMALGSIPNLAPAQASTLTLDGVDIAETEQAGATKLLLNGAAIQKRAFFKTNTVAIYLPEKCRSLEAILKQPGPQRLHITALRNFSGGMAARQFLSDFKNFSSEAELDQLSKEINVILSIYAGIEQINKGDTILVDWTADGGMVVTLQGKTISTGLTNPLLWELSLRPLISAQASQEMREHLLGLSPH